MSPERLVEFQVFENLYSELPVQTVMIEDVAPSTSVANGQHGMHCLSKYDSYRYRSRIWMTYCV